MLLYYVENTVPLKISDPIAHLINGTQPSTLPHHMAVAGNPELILIHEKKCVKLSMNEYLESSLFHPLIWVFIFVSATISLFLKLLIKQAKDVVCVPDVNMQV